MNEVGLPCENITISSVRQYTLSLPKHFLDFSNNTEIPYS